MCVYKCNMIQNPCQWFIYKLTSFHCDFVFEGKIYFQTEVSLTDTDLFEFAIWQKCALVAGRRQSMNVFYSLSVSLLFISFFLVLCSLYFLPFFVSFLPLPLPITFTAMTQRYPWNPRVVVLDASKIPLDMISPHEQAHICVCLCMCRCVLLSLCVEGCGIGVRIAEGPAEGMGGDVLCSILHQHYNIHDIP